MPKGRSPMAPQCQTDAPQPVSSAAQVATGTIPYTAPSAAADAAVGCILGHMIGDALGTCCEGWSAKQIRELARSRFPEPECKGLVWDFIPCIHMGQGMYVGPPKPCDEAYARRGMYSDDTNAALALASSLVDSGRLDGPHAARQYAEFFFDEDCPTRFCPPTAEAVMQRVLDGMDYKATGLPPHFPFQGGSFANGGGMRASPLGIFFRGADATQMRAIAEEAVRSSHAHPEAVDGAAVQAYAVALAARLGAAGRACEFCPAAFLRQVSAAASTPAFQRRLDAIHKELTALRGSAKADDVQVLRRIVDEGDPRDRRQGSGFDFQIAAVDMTPCVLWIAARYHHVPEEAIMRAISIGGDTDTCACMVGAILGALHGTKWIPLRWWDGVENGKRGRDYAVSLAERLAELSPPEACD